MSTKSYFCTCIENSLEDIFNNPKNYKNDNHSKSFRHDIPTKRMTVKNRKNPHHLGSNNSSIMSKWKKIKHEKNILTQGGVLYDFKQILPTVEEVDSNMTTSRCIWRLNSPTSILDKISHPDSGESGLEDISAEYLQLRKSRIKCLALENKNVNLKFLTDRITHENTILAARIELLRTQNERLKKQNSVYATSSAENTFLETDSSHLSNSLSKLENEIESQNEAHYRLQNNMHKLLKDKKSLEKDKLQYELTTVSKQEELGTLSKKVQHLESLKDDVQKKRLYINRLQELIGIFRVFLCVRPLMNVKETSCLEYISSDKVKLRLKREGQFPASGKEYIDKTFHFNKVFNCENSKSDIYKDLSNYVAMTLNGFNVCILSYGMTGTGKTHTLIGKDDSQGLISFAFTDIIEALDTEKSRLYSIKMSFLEIYQEKLYCVLTRKNIILHDSGSLVKVKGQKEVLTNSTEEMHNLLSEARRMRRTGANSLNKSASHSHFFVIIKVNCKNSLMNTETNGMLMIGDLAGFDKADTFSRQPGLVSPQNATINQSLVNFGSVIDGLRYKRSSIPFRNSKLTQFLRPCFTGDSITCLLITATPDTRHSFSTLRSLEVGEATMNTVLGAAECHVENNSFNEK